MKGIVDRIENGIAVVETKSGMLDLPAPDGLQDGDFVELENGKIVSIDGMPRRRAAPSCRSVLTA